MDSNTSNNKMKIKKILKNGVEKIYEYDQKEYNKKYYSKNKEMLNKSIECALCKGTYCIMSKSKHMQSPRHCKFIEKEEEEQKEEETEEENETKQEEYEKNIEYILANKKTYI
jgi:hypothetical protein